MALRSFVVTLTVLACVSVAAQVAPDDPDAAFAARIDELSSQLYIGTFSDLPRDEAAGALEQIDRATALLKAEVDRFVSTAASTGATAPDLQGRLRALLHEHGRSVQWDEPPTVRASNPRHGPSLLVAYRVVSGPHFSAPTLRGYRYGLSGVELVASTAEEDFRGHTLLTTELASPVSGETWILAWGQSITANGLLPIIRVQAYAFDGETFRTMPSPGQFAGVQEVVVSAGGTVVEIEHRMRRPPYELRDRYLVTASGLIKTTPGI